MSADDFKAIRRELAAAEALGDVQKCIEICRTAMTDELNSDPQNLWHFGIKLAAWLLAEQEPSREEEVDEAIQLLSRMLTVITRQDQPGYWARLHLQLGVAIASRKGDPHEAIRHYEKALEVLTKDKHPEEWALAKRAAGDAYYRLAQDNDSISDLSKASTYYREALTVFTPEKYPDEGLVETINVIENVVAKATALTNSQTRAS